MKNGGYHANSRRQICTGFPNAYWLKLDHEDRYPSEFVSALTEAGYLAALIPEDGRLLFVPDARALLMVGVCGGFTTFSSFSMEVINLMRNDAWAPAFGYIAASVILCLAATAAAFFAITALQR